MLKVKTEINVTNPSKKNQKKEEELSNTQGEE